MARWSVVNRSINYGEEEIEKGTPSRLRVSSRTEAPRGANNPLTLLELGEIGLLATKETMSQSPLNSR
jgi:hypothetical protein